MALQNTIFVLLFVMCTAAVSCANLCTKHSASPREKKVTDEIEKRKDEFKKQQEKVKALVDRITAEIERESCTRPLPESWKSCSDLKKLNRGAKDGNYSIDPDGDGGLGPFTAYCDMTDKNGVGVTVISHDSESETHVKNYEDPGSYSCDIHYTGASLSQLAGLTRVSSHCEQFIKYRCYHAELFQIYGNERVGWWVSRDSRKMYYWGGSSVSGKCACGMTKSCANPKHGCNCDKNDKAWREDSGLLTNKTHLPVKQLRFGDTGHDQEHAFHTLGKLKCFGIA